VEIRRCDAPEERAALAALVNHREGEGLRRAAAAGRICLGAWRGGTPVGYTWLSTHVSPDVEGFPIPLPEDAIYAWNLYVAPEERRSGIGSALASARLRVSRELGYRTGWRAIDTGNLGSVGTVRNTAGDGTRIVGRLRYVRILGWTCGDMAWEREGPPSAQAP
jgi:GNAT superfamily N-acetyltransferase